MGLHKTDYSNKQYLSKDDFAAGEKKELVIASVSEEKVSSPEGDKSLKAVVHFEGETKPLVLNQTNWDTIEETLDQPDTDEWPSQTITLYVDPNVSFGGRRTGGIRVQGLPF